MAKTWTGITWDAFPKQAIFLGTFAEVDEVMFGGSAGPGKSEALLMYAAQRRINYPGSSGLFLRRTYAQLSKSGAAIDMSHKLYGGIAEWNATERKWTFFNGSVQEFGHCENEADKHNYQSAQYLDVVFDELTQFTEGIYTYIAFSRGRTVEGGRSTQIRSASNPGGIGHAWVKKRFIDPMPPYEVLEETKIHPITKKPIKITRAFVPAGLADNPFLMENDPQYAIHLMELPENERRALLEGRWDLFEGQALTEWDPAQHIVQPFFIPIEWPRWVSIDYGYEAPMSVHWYAKDLRLWRERKIDRYYCYRELYERGMEPKQQALAIRRLSGDERVRMYIADPSIWISKGKGLSTADDYMQMGLRPLTKGLNDRIMGKGRVHWLLGKAQDGLPRVQFFNTCRHMTRTLPLLQHDKKKVEDIDTDGDDHGYDDLRYFASHVSIPVIRQAPQSYQICA